MTLHRTLMILTLAVVVGACSREVSVEEPIRSVKLVTVQPASMQAQGTFAGEVRARVESRLGFRVGGKLVQRPVEVGQRVRAGQLLAQLDVSDLALASQAAEAQVQAAQTQRDLAAADLQRFKELRSQGFVSSAEIERRQAALDAADATLRQARAQSAVQGNQATYARLLADGPGVVLSVDAEVGQVVAAGSPVLRLARDGARDVVVSVPEQMLAALRPGQKADVRLWAAGGESGPVWTAVVREIAASADPLTRTYAVRLTLPGDAALPLGATATVALTEAAQVAAPPAVIKLPSSAVMSAGAGDAKASAVWVFDPTTQTVQTREVTVTGADGNEVLIAGGLNPGEEVVAVGTHVLSAGQKVTRFVGADNR